MRADLRRLVTCDSKESKVELRELVKRDLAKGSQWLIISKSSGLSIVKEDMWREINVSLSRDLEELKVES
jgi:hypothetical protein